MQQRGMSIEIVVKLLALAYPVRRSVDLSLSLELLGRGAHSEAQDAATKEVTGIFPKRHLSLISGCQSN